MPLVSLSFPFLFEGARKGESDWLTPSALLCLVVVWGPVGVGPQRASAQEVPTPDSTVSDTIRRSRGMDELGPERAPSTDSIAVGDSVAAQPRVSVDTQEVAPIDTALVRRYVPTRRRPSFGLFETVSPLIGPRTGPSEDRTITLDSTEHSYILEEKVRHSGPVRLDADVYRRERYRANLRDNWRTLADEQQRREGSNMGVGVNMVVPGGRESAFSTVFGKPQVDLRMNGSADINAGFDYRKSDQQVNRTGGDASQINPNFRQDLQLGITGTIGDKLQINVDWDTESQFNYQNQVKLDYTGYEDEILQNVEAGNVSMQTPSQLISGGQSLFGIKSQFQLGNLTLTTIASQQEGHSNSLNIEGGAQETEFDLQPTDYDANRHFFLAYYFRNHWNASHEDPSRIGTFDGFDEITEIEVWKTTQRAESEADRGRAVAVVDLGEEAVLLDSTDAYQDGPLPHPDNDQYTEANLSALRDGETRASSYLDSPNNVEHPLDIESQQDMHSGEFKRLQKGDYRLHRRLGYISLQQRLQSDEALAVAFRYRTVDGTVETVGDFAGDRGGTGTGVNADRLILKLLRPSEPVAPNPNGGVSPAAWFLQLRNIYRLGGRDFTQETFEMDIEYQPSGQGAQNTIRAIGGQERLLQLLGLDRVDTDGAPNPDGRFDFLGQTMNTDEGLITFPYLQPFGERILEVGEERGSRAAARQYAFENLYTKKQSNARKEDTEKNVYHLRGTFSSGSQQFYDLGTITGVVEGSVEITNGGQTLQEGVDYRVDYQGGTVNILNETYTADGRTLNISWEQKNLINLQKKTLLGARADWSLREEISLGATVMRLSQKSPVDKFRIGKEPIKNTIWGLNGSMDLEPRWLTQAVDALPLVQTRAESQLSVSGEFAELRPGHTTTDAFQSTVDRVQESETDSFAPDELDGVSYIDDFEGFENTFSLSQNLSAWQVSAAPDSTANEPGLDGDETVDDGHVQRTHWRGSLGWYRLNKNILDQLSGTYTRKGPEEASSLVKIKDVFVNRDTRGQVNTNLRTLDLYFDPWQRGPYNYTNNLEGFFGNPKKVWGGIARALPEGYNDFSVQNVEFVEFIVKVYPQNGRISDGARLFVNLGTISEDVVPNKTIDTEDGLSLQYYEGDIGPLSRRASSDPGEGLRLEGERTQDLGLDGYVSYTDSPYEAPLLEETRYSGFIEQADSLSNHIGQLGLTRAQQERLRREVARIKEDPSADDYHYYENNRYFNSEEFFPDGVTLQQRFSRYYAGHELNGFESQNELAEDVSVRRGVSRSPDGESLEGQASNIEITNNYFQYAIPLDELEERAESEGGPTDYVVSKVGRNKDWYKVRIPVRNFTDKVGSIQSFDNIQSMRLWTTGHSAPVTMRFASLELVGSQWRASEAVATQPVESGHVSEKGQGELRVASLNNEEDLSYRKPVGAVVAETRTAQGRQQTSREQALLLGVDELGPGQQRGIYKTFGEGLDLLKYSNLRMYTHLHGQSNSSQTKERLENLRMFVRLGASESGDYYEYEQELKPGDVPSANGAQNLWPEEYEMNLVLERLNRLKVLRGQSGVRTDTTFSSERAGVDLDLDFAPPNTVLRIRGTPSLRDVQTIVVGVRHAGDPDTSPRPEKVRNFELWINELRVSGYDEEKGWAANANVTVDLADFASVQGSFQRRTGGFGGLSSTLDERERSDNTSWNVRADINLDTFLPEEQGWSVPVTLQVQSNHTIPRYDPNRGDVEVRTVARQFDDVPGDTLQQRFDRYGDLPADEIRSRLKDSVRTAAETYNIRRTMTANLSKQGSDSWWMQKTVDGVSLNFSYLDRSAHNPQRQLDEQWSWSGAFEYQLSFGEARTVRPLGFFPDVPVLGTLSDLTFNYVPRSLSFTSSADRNATTTRSRTLNRQGGQDLPARVAFPLREQEDFGHRRTFSLQYDPFQFLSLSFDTNTQQSLKDVAARTQTNVIFHGHPDVSNRVFRDIEINPDSTHYFFGDPGPSAYIDDLPSDAEITSADEGKTVFFEEQLFRRSEVDVFRRLLRGQASPRTNTYKQRFSATLSMGWTDQEWLNWIDVRDISYNSSFDWTNGAEGSRTGANVRNSLTLQTGMSLQPNRVWERFGFFRSLKEAQRSSGDEEEQGGRSEGRAAAGEEGEGGGEGEGESGDGSSDEGGGLSLSDVPVPNPVGMLRGLALMVLDIDDITVNYQGDWSARSSNVGSFTNPDSIRVSDHHSLLDAFRGEGPSVGYRFGLERSIDPRANRLLLDQLQVTDALGNQHSVEGRTTLSPSQSFTVDLSWDVEWREQTNTTFQKEQEESVERFVTRSGNSTVSVWGFGDFPSLFETQLNRLQQDFGGEDGSTPSARAVALTNASVVGDFRDTYLMSGRNLLSRGFVPFPMPGWNVRYSGLSDWPLLGQLIEGATLSHSYNGQYESSFSPQTASDSTLTVDLSGQKYVRPSFETGTSRVSEQFRPLLGVDLTWPGNLQTSVEWNRQTTTYLRTASLKVEEVKTSELSGSVSYRKRGLNIPFFGMGRLENQIQFSLTLSRSVNDERTYNLTGALQQGQSGDVSAATVTDATNRFVVVQEETTRLKVTPELTYRLSDSVTANFLLEYEKFNGDNSTPSYTSVNGGFNVQVNFSQY